MKTKTLNTSLLVLIIAFTSGSVLAHPGGHADEPMEHSQPAVPAEPAEKLPETVGEIFKAIDNQQASLKSALGEGKLTTVQSHALTINTLVQHLVTKVPADHQASVKEIAVRHAQITTDLVKASSAGARKETEANVTKISGNIRALKTQAH